MSILLDGINEDDEIVYETGQRKCGPPSDWNLSPPGKGCEVFIAKIPKDFMEYQLIPLFKSIGPIYMFRLMMENEQNHRGFGFCIYTNPEHATEAVCKLNNYQVKPNWFLGVCFSVDNCRLFVGGIPKQKRKADIMEEMSKVTDNVVDVIVYPSAADKSKNRGFAFIEYTDHKSASIARKKMINGAIHLWGHKVAVDWAEPERKVDEETMAQVKILYIRNLQLSTTEETIYQKFCEHTTNKDEIVRVRKLGDFAFVHFQNREQAELVKNKMDGTELEGSEIEVHFAKPVNRVEQQQKMMRNSMSIMMSKEFDKMSLNNSTNGILKMGTLNNETNGLSKSFRNAAGRCSLKSKQMLKNFDATREMTSNNFTALLTQICHQNNWGTPYFSVQMIPIVFPNNESSLNLFISQVYIPGLNCHFPSKTGSFTHEEAIWSASENALQWMFYNGIQIPLLLGQVNKSSQDNSSEVLNESPNSNKSLINSYDMSPEQIETNSSSNTNSNNSIFTLHPPPPPAPHIIYNSYPPPNAPPQYFNNICVPPPAGAPPLPQPVLPPTPITQELTLTNNKDTLA